MKKRSVLMFITVLVMSVCMIMALGISASATNDNEIEVVEETLPEGENQEVTLEETPKEEIKEEVKEEVKEELPELIEEENKEDPDEEIIEDISDVEKEEEPEEIVESETEPEIDDDKDIEDEDEDLDEDIDEEESLEDADEEEKNEEPAVVTEDKKEEQSTTGGSNYIIMVNDQGNGKSVNLPGGEKILLTDILQSLEYELNENSIIDVDLDTVDTDTYTLTQDENGQWVILDNGHFEKAAKNLRLTIDGVEVELELVDDYDFYVDAAGSNDNAGTKEKPFATIAKALEKAGTSKTKITLLSNIEENVTIAANQDITLDLAGRVLKAAQAGSVITNYGTLTIQDSSDAKTGKITGGTGYCIKEQDIEYYYGGGVYNAGTLTITGGTITECTADYGSAVYNSKDSNFTLKGGTISATKSNITNGSVVYNDGTFTMDDGTISGSKNSGNTLHGVWNDYNGSFTMKGGTITNHSNHGIYNYGAFMMTDGTISANSGTGVFMERGTFTMENGTISENSGRGVFLSGNTFTMIGGTVTGNTGGGVYCEDNFTFTVGGTAKITGNTSNSAVNNVYLREDKTITISTENAPATGMSIGVTLESVTGTVTSTNDADYSSYFFSDNSAYVVVNSGTDDNQVLKIVEAVAEYNNIKYATVQDAIDAAGTAKSKVELIKDVTENIIIEKNQEITLDLNGHVLKATGDNVLSVINNYGTLTIMDSRPEATHADSSLPAGGVITGGTRTIIGSGFFGGGVYNDGTLTLSGGTISGNSLTDGQGGGVYNNRSGTFTMTGGTISGNTSSTLGGGVYNYGTFTMTGGMISGNTADYGGGVYNASDATFTMTGGTISGNTASSECGGVYNSGTFTVGGTAVIKENTVNGQANNVYLSDNKTITIATGDDAPASTMSIGVTLESGYGNVTTANSENYKTYFASDNIAYGVYNSGKDSNQHVYIGNPEAQIAETGAMYETIDSAFNAVDTTNKTVKLLKDYNGNLTIASGKTVVLDLNGYVLKATSGSVITNNGNLTIQDSNPNATHTDDSLPAGGVITGGTGTTYYGGGVYNQGKLTFISGIISGNTATRGGGVCNALNSTFELAGGTICGNTASLGAGVENEGAFKLVSGIISGNTATTGGGAVHTENTFEMTGGTISGNTATDQGGGVNCIGSNGTITLTGGIISNNKSGTGGGLYTCRTITVGGTLQITGNTLADGTTASNVYLSNATHSSIIIEVSKDTPPVEQQMSLGVTLEKGYGYVTSASNADNTKYFTSDNSAYGVYNSGLADSYRVYIGSPVAQNANTGIYYEKVQTAIDDASQNDVIKLVKDEVIENISNTRTITLDLNGHTLKGDGTSSVITNKGTLTIEDSSDAKSGKITGGKAVNGGGVNNSGTLTLNSGTISGNTATQGGGVYNGGTLTLNGGTISDNTAEDAGGVYNGGTLTLNGGLIKDNTASSMGGGVKSYASFTMTKGEISGNKAALGGGIYNSNSFTMIGGTISGNAADEGGGVYNVYKFTVGGTAVVKGNTVNEKANNVYLPKDVLISISKEKAPAMGMSIGVTLESITGNVTDAGSEDYTSYFTSDASYGVHNAGKDKKQQVYIGNPTVQNDTTGAFYETLQDAINDAKKENVIKLSTGITENIIVGEKANITLDLNGYTIDGGKKGSVITNSGTLKIQDSSDAKSGKITGGKADNGGGVYNTGILTMTGGTISGNEATVGGGGVYNAGRFTMLVGTIGENKSSLDGGGVYNADEFWLRGGKISDNEAQGDGGGVYNYSGDSENPADFIMRDGLISGNTASRDGGGVTNLGEITMTGGTITGNTAEIGAGVMNYFEFAVGGSAKITENTSSDGETASNVGLIAGESVIIVETGYSAPESDMKIGVTIYTWENDEPTITTGAITSAGNGNYSQYFVSDDPRYVVVNTGSGENQVLQLQVPTSPAKEKAAATTKPLGKITLDKPLREILVDFTDLKDFDSILLIIEEILPEKLTKVMKEAVDKLVADKGNDYTVIDTYILVGDQHVKQLNGAIATITIDPEGITAFNAVDKELVLYEIAEDGTMTEISYEIVDGKIVFETKELCTYVITTK